MLGKRIEELENQMRSLRTKDKIQIVKTSSLDSSSSTTTSNHEDVATPDDIDDEDDGEVPDDERDDDNDLPPELDKLVKEAINELKNRDLAQSQAECVVNSNNP